MSLNPTQDAIKTAEAIFKVLDEEHKICKDLATDPLLYKADRAVRKMVVDNPAQQAVVNQWRAVGRQLLAIHPELVSELRDAKTVSVVTEVVAALPYMNPMVIFGEPIPLGTWRHDKDETMLLRGMLFYGRVRIEGKDVNKMGTLCGTHDPEAAAIGALMFFQIRDNVTGEIRDDAWEMDRMSIPLDRPHLDIDEMSERMVDKYGWDSPVVNNETGKEFMASGLRVLIGVLLYLCSTTLDAEMVPKSRMRSVSLPGIRKPPSLVKVGWTIGPALTNARKEWHEGKRHDMGGSRGPEHRRGYFATRWCGKGRATAKTVYVSPYITRRDLWDRIDTKTVRPVPKPKVVGHAPKTDT